MSDRDDDMVIRGGMLDMTDPRQAEAFRDAMEELRPGDRIVGFEKDGDEWLPCIVTLVEGQPYAGSRVLYARDTRIETPAGWIGELHLDEAGTRYLLPPTCECGAWLANGRDCPSCQGALGV